ncbi:MAG: amidase [Candidatus Lokiarchaeota archaeon]|nr:amidase [Candidatus Lokiarchaeota archaeon]
MGEKLMKSEDICYMSAYEMVDKIKTQELTSSEITETIIERIEKINPIINAYCTPTFDLAREMAKNADNAVQKREKLGLLHGIPSSIKDLIETKNIRTTFGCKIYEHNIPKEDEIVVQRLKKERIVLLGKTNTPSFGHKAVTDNFIFGETKNPWDLKKTSGGSSGGAAAAVASGLGPLAIGSDGGGSIRIPSCLCGIYGLKPNYGRIARKFTKIGFYYFSHYGPITRYVKDAALMLDAISGAHSDDKYSFSKPTFNFLEALKEIPKDLKIGYSLDLGIAKVINPEIEKNFFDAVKKFEQLNWKVENVKLKLRKAYRSFVILVTAGLAFDHKSEVKKWRDKMSPTLLKLIEAGKGYSSLDIMGAEYQCLKFYNYFNKFFKEYDVLITPTTAVPAFDLGKMFPQEIADKSVSPASWMPYTFPFNMTCHPAASIPSGWTQDGLPLGIQIVGNKLDEKTVLQVSKAFEDLAPWQAKKPNFS